MWAYCLLPHSTAWGCNEFNKTLQCKEHIRLQFSFNKTLQWKEHIRLQFSHGQNQFRLISGLVWIYQESNVANASWSGASSSRRSSRSPARQIVKLPHQHRTNTGTRRSDGAGGWRQLHSMILSSTPHISVSGCLVGCFINPLICHVPIRWL